MKHIKYIVVAILPLLFVIFLLVQQRPTTVEDIHKFKQMLQIKMDKELFVDVLDNIANYKGDVTLELLHFKAKAYENLKQNEEAIAVYEQIIRKFPNDKEAYEKLLAYYENDYPQKYIRLLYDTKNVFPTEFNDEIVAFQLGFQKTYVPAHKVFNSKSAYSIFEQDGKYGIMTKEMDILVEAEFDKLFDYSEHTGFFGAVKEGRAFYVDENGYKREVPDMTYQELGYQNGGFAVAKKEGKYGYVDYKLNELSDFVYEDATAFNNGLAAVKEDGKWYFISENFRKINDIPYEAIMMDRNRVMNAFGVLWVKRDNRWQLLDTQLNEISIPTVKQVKIFISDQPTAVEFEDGWGYLTTSGKMVNEQRFLSANAFNLDKSFVQVEKEKWQVISSTFDKGEIITAKFVDNVQDMGITQVFEDSKVNYFVKFNQHKTYEE